MASISGRLPNIEKVKVRLPLPENQNLKGAEFLTNVGSSNVAAIARKVLSHKGWKWVITEPDVIYCQKVNGRFE